MRETVYGFLTGHAPLTAIVPVGWWYQSGAVVDKPQKPFVVLRWLAPVALATSFGHQLRIDVHDNRGSYQRIDQFRRLVTPLLSGTTQLEGSDGRVTEFSYLGHGGDQEDPDYGTNYGFTSWQVIGVEG